MGDSGEPEKVPRLCHIVRWPNFNGYGFNLHAEKGKAGQFIGKVDEGSPAEAAGLKAGDRIVEVNGTNIGNENHQQVVGRIKAGGDETRLLVVDQETDQLYKEEKKVVRGELPEVKFLTAARDEDQDGQNETTQAEDVPAAVIGSDSNGPDVEPQTLPDDSSQYTPRLCNLCKWPDFDGYGFNLHAEKDKPGQYIGMVDADSPAELGGLREGDRIIEVNGDNIETSTHGVVIQKIKSGGDKTSMLVVDKATDEYFKSRGQTVCSSMTSVLVISTPPRVAETTESVTAVWAAEQVESAPVPDEIEAVQNGTEEVAMGISAVSVTENVVVAAEENAGEEERGDYNAYEEVEVTSPTPATTTLSYQEDLGSASNGMNGGSAVVAEPEPAVIKASEQPQFTVVHTSSTAGGDLNLNLSAAEMKERLKSRKKQDPRLSKTSFESKYKMFEKM